MCFVTVKVPLSLKMVVWCDPSLVSGLSLIGEFLGGSWVRAGNRVQEEFGTETPQRVEHPERNALSEDPPERGALLERGPE